MRKVRTGLLVTALALWTAAAGAADTPATPGAGRSTPPPVDTMPDKDETLEFARNAVAEMEGSLVESQEKEASAVGVKDFMQVNCVDEKVKAMMGLLQIGQMARKSLEDAFKDYENAKPVDAQAVQDARGQLIDAQTKMRALSAEAEQIKLVQHNKTKLTLAKSRVRTLRSEVDNCVGEMSMYTGESVTEASIDDDIREDDPTEGEILAGDPLDSERPYDMTPSMPR
ncbi:MAG: hypothetical protein ACOYM9_08150 [Bradymonadia bacterium]|jgi:hypothetical protein